MADSRIKALAARIEPYAYAALRIVGSAMFAFHGLQKLTGWHAKQMPHVGSQIWFGGLIELFGGLMILLGICTRPAAFFASGMMAVAYFQFHWKFVMTDDMWLPAQNHGELAALYCFVFFFISAHGSGILSIDNWRRR